MEIEYESGRGNWATMILVNGRAGSTDLIACSYSHFLLFISIHFDYVFFKQPWDTLMLSCELDDSVSVIIQMRPALQMLVNKDTDWSLNILLASLPIPWLSCTCYQEVCLDSGASGGPPYRRQERCHHIQLKNVIISNWNLQRILLLVLTKQGNWRFFFPLVCWFSWWPPKQEVRLASGSKVKWWWGCQKQRGIFILLTTLLMLCYPEAILTSCNDVINRMNSKSTW